MKITELITHLERALSEHGDLDVMVDMGEYAPTDVEEPAIEVQRNGVRVVML